VLTLPLLLTHCYIAIAETPLHTYWQLAAIGSSFIRGGGEVGVYSGAISPTLTSPILDTSVGFWNWCWSWTGDQSYNYLTVGYR